MAQASVTVFYKGEMIRKWGGNRSEVRSMYADYTDPTKAEQTLKELGERITDYSELTFVTKYNKYRKRKWNGINIPLPPGVKRVSDIRGAKPCKCTYTDGDPPRMFVKFWGPVMYFEHDCPKPPPVVTD